MVRKVDRTVIRPVDEHSIPAPDGKAPSASNDSFIRGTKGIVSPAAKVNASRFGDPITNFFASFRALPQAEQAVELARLTSAVFKEQPKRG